MKSQSCLSSNPSVFPRSSQSLVDPSGNVSIILQVGEKDIASRRASVPASGVAQIYFDCQMQSEGMHALTVRIEDELGCLPTM